MITCPWCGTSYVAFQSNCKNCGGPLLPPTPVKSQVESELPAPPPPPRAISTAYTWKLMSTDAGSIGGFVVMMVGFIFGIVGVGLTAGIITAFVGIPFAVLGLAMLVGGAGMVYWRYQEKHKIVAVLQTGQTARGQIIAVDENMAVSINNRHPWNIRYGFIYNGQNWEGSTTTLNTPGPNLQPGQATWVLYMPESPELNAIFPHP